MRCDTGQISFRGTPTPRELVSPCGVLTVSPGSLFFSSSGSAPPPGAAANLKRICPLPSISLLAVGFGIPDFELLNPWMVD
jgi:hypothetical protein